MDRNETRAVVAQTVLAHAAWAAIRLMIGYRALADGADAAFLGVIAASFVTPALFAAILVGRLADRFGGAAVVVFGVPVASAGECIVLLSHGRWLLPAAAAIVGLGYLMIMVGQQTYVAHWSVQTTRDGAFGTVTAAASTGQLIGPLVITALASMPAITTSAHEVNTDAGIIAAGIFGLSALPTALWMWRHRGSGPKEFDSGDAGIALRLFRLPGMAKSIAISAVVLTTVDLMYAFVPAWATERNIAATTVGWLFALRAAISIATRIELARLVKRFGPTVLLRVSIGTAALAIAFLPFVRSEGAIVVMAALGVVLGIPQPLTMSWVVSLVPRPMQGQALGLRTSANRLVQTTIPILVGTVAGPYGITAVFFANSLLLGASLTALVRPGLDR
ncbi:multidrug resistance protein [Mycobacterium basiliense]|uniref:Multidrug resistance protein n=1 Tax=Mycobacterium basiliense TaxID=2094119 RepID=A0A3S5CZF2_9MYCO|nr:MFS transporter [Mycobacterium basiliense]VDM86569.1 multidrug resistance protein [Mycobacterium basiliense]